MDRRFSKTYKSLNNEYKTLCLLSRDEPFDTFRFCELIGKINFAAENKMIDMEEWEILFEKTAKKCRGA